MIAARIEKMLYGGNGLSVSGAEIPFVLPNELVEVTPSNQIRILESSADRITPRCIHFGACGGCHYQYAAYPAQLTIKRTILRDTLISEGLTSIPEVETRSADPWHYRNRIRLRIGHVGGQLSVGYNRHGADGGEALLPVTMCPIAAPILWHAASTLLGLADSNPTIQTWMANSAELELFTNADETALQLTLFTRNPPGASFAAFCIAAQRAIPQLTGAGVALLPRRPSPQGRRSERPKPGAQWGAPGLIYAVDSENEQTPHWVSRGGFFQSNRHLVSTLATVATTNRSGALAWDLYAGVGLFSRILARHFQQIIAVEASESAATDLAASLAKAPNGKNHRSFKATTLEFLQAEVVQRERPQLILMDPPRAGLGSEVCALLARIRAPELIYVSCDPITLVRDLAHLTASGYSITSLHLVDMFPQTFHMETVATLRRAG